MYLCLTRETVVSVVRFVMLMITIYSCLVDYIFISVD